MFSHNKKISARQMRSLLIMDWLAKLCLLFPIFLTGRSLGTMVGCLAIGLLAWLWFSVLLVKAAKDHEDFFDTVSRLGGRGSALLVYLIGLLYFLSHTAVCMSFCADLAQTYMLPDVPLPVLVILPLAAGLYLAYSGIEVRGRVSEFLVPILLFFFLFMAAAAVPGMNLTESGQTLLEADRRLFAGGYEVFAAVGGMFLPVLAAYLPDKKKNFGKGIRRAACWSLIPAGILLFITAGSFGTEGMLAFRFPGIRVMSNVAVPGGFVQRWDILFLSLLLFSLAVSVASGFWYLNTIAERLWNEAVSYWPAWKEYRKQNRLGSWAGAENAGGLALRRWQQEFAEEFGADKFAEKNEQNADGFAEKNEQGTDRSAEKNGQGMDGFTEKDGQNADSAGAAASVLSSRSHRGLLVLQGVLAFIAFGAAGGFRSAEAAIIYYRAYNLYVLTPVMFLVYLMLYFRGKQSAIKRRTVKTAAACILLCLLLTGCTARELEDRMFPMALEIRVDGGTPTMIYAWNGESDSGSGGGERSREQESDSETEQECGDESENGTKQEESKKEKETEQGFKSEEAEKRAGGESGSGAEAGSQERAGGESDNKAEAESAADAEMEERNETESRSVAEKEETPPDTVCEPREEGNLTIFQADNLAEIQKQVAEYGDRYIDYSHVKAIIWDERLEQYPGLEREIYEWLAAEPAFAANLIIYPARESGLTLEQADERSDGEIGVYLENLYQNNRKLRESAVTLGKMAARYYNL